MYTNRYLYKRWSYYGYYEIFSNIILHEKIEFHNLLFLKNEKIGNKSSQLTFEILTINCEAIAEMQCNYVIKKTKKTV